MNLSSLVIVLSMYHAQHQSTLRTVIWQKAHEPIIGATVQVKDKIGTVLQIHRMEFALKMLQKSEVCLNVSYIGYVSGKVNFHPSMRVRSKHLLRIGEYLRRFKTGAFDEVVCFSRINPDPKESKLNRSRYSCHLCRYSKHWFHARYHRYPSPARSSFTDSGSVHPDLCIGDSWSTSIMNVNIREQVPW